MKLFPIIFILLFFVSCTSHKKHKQDIQDKVSNETEVYDGKSLGAGLYEVIRSSETLTAEQKKELEKILAETKLKNRALMEESFKMRSVLIKGLITEKSSSKEVKLLKKKIRKSESARLKNTFAAIDKISIIVSKDPDQKKYIEQLIYFNEFHR